MKLEKFGIEIRKLGTVGSLYQDVDRTLKAVGCQHGEVSGIIQTQTIAHALQKMITGTYFSVSTVTECRDIAHLVISAERMLVYRAAHCIHYNEMLPEYRQALIAMVLDDFRSVLNPAEEAELIKT